MIDSHAVRMMSGDDYNEPYSFASWDRNARKDGWVCRSDEDCEWLDPHLGCDDNEFEMRNVQVWWFFRTHVISILVYKANTKKDFLLNVHINQICFIVSWQI